MATISSWVSYCAIPVGLVTQAAPNFCFPHENLLCGCARKVALLVNGTFLLAVGAVTAPKTAALGMLTYTVFSAIYSWCIFKRLNHPLDRPIYLISSLPLIIAPFAVLSVFNSETENEKIHFALAYIPFELLSVVLSYLTSCMLRSPTEGSLINAEIV